MKLRIFISTCLLALSSAALANHAIAGKFYVGAFGGGGASNDFNASQFGTAFYTEAQGGPLSVNAFGELASKSNAFWGAQLGYQAPGICLSSCSQWRLAPGTELEGYAMSNNSFDGALINDNTNRLPEHDFIVSYPMNRAVFIANAVLNFDRACCAVHPYIGLGFGNAIVRVSDASSLQVNPPEEGVNHYGASSSDSISTFAGQLKLGLSYDINKCLSLFAEYRALYLASTHFVFGSTIYPGHPETSSWQVKLNSQVYNLGNVGIRLNW